MKCAECGRVFAAKDTYSVLCPDVCQPKHIMTKFEAYKFLLSARAAQLRDAPVQSIPEISP